MSPIEFHPARMPSINITVVMSSSFHVAIVCPGLTNPANGGITFTNGNNFGSVATHNCEEGFTLTGDVARVCLGQGVWTGSDPTCDGR